MRLPLALAALLQLMVCNAGAEAFNLFCQGDIETRDKNILAASVFYPLRYEITGSRANIHFAGKTFVATVEKVKSRKGKSIKKIDEEMNFSFLPDEGGKIRFQFDQDRWYSGICL